MELIIMRHGEAGRHTQDDALRELTATGRAATRKVAQEMLEARWPVDEIWCSSLVRARQTALIVGELLQLQPIEQPFLTPDDNPNVTLDVLQAIPDHCSIMLVSHMPLVSMITSLLLDGSYRGHAFSTSQAVRLSMPVAGLGCATLLASLYPK